MKIDVGRLTFGEPLTRVLRVVIELMRTDAPSDEQKLLKASSIRRGGKTRGGRSS